MVIIFIISTIILAIVSGLLSGLLGIGGNILSIPILVYLMQALLHLKVETAEHVAIASSVLIMVCTTFGSFRAHLSYGNVVLEVVKEYAPFIIIGVIGGSWLSAFINGRTIEIVFALFIIVVGSKFLFFDTNNKEGVAIIKKLSLFWRILIGFTIGFKSGLLGIGGGTILIPLLLFLGYDAKKTSGTTSAFTFLISLIASLSFIINRHNYLHPIDIPYSFGYINIPIVIIMAPLTYFFAKIGARLVHYIPQKVLRKGFALLLLALGFHVLV